MDTSISQQAMKLLVVGKTGVGKSCTANTILGRNAFVSKQSASSVTKETQGANGEQQGRKIKMVDMPGLRDASLTPEKDTQLVATKAAEAVAETPGGYDAILIVISFGKFTQEDKQTISCLKSIFGEEYLKQYGILVVTFGDLYDPAENGGQSFKQWCSTQEGDFKNLIEECDGRVVMLQNKTKDETIRKQQLEQLFIMVDRVKCGGKYTPQLFERAQEEIVRLDLEQKLEVVTDETEVEMDLIVQEMKRLSEGKFAEDVTRLRQLSERVNTLVNEILDRVNTNTNSKRTIKTLKLVLAIQVAVTAMRNAVEWGLENVEANRLAQQKTAEAEQKYQKWTTVRAKLKKVLKYILIGVVVGVGICFAIYMSLQGGPVTGIVRAAIQTGLERVSKKGFETVAKEGFETIEKVASVIKKAVTSKQDRAVAGESAVPLFAHFTNTENEAEVELGYSSTIL